VLDEAVEDPDGRDGVAGPATAGDVAGPAAEDEEDDVPVPDASMKTAGTAPPGKTDPNP
jgi:hypothetical protein